MKKLLSTLLTLAGLLTPTLFAHADITTGLQVYYTFDAASSGSCTGTTPDASGNGNTGTCQNSPTYVAGKIGAGAISFNPTSSYISTPYNPGGPSNITACTWINPETPVGFADPYIFNSVNFQLYFLSDTGGDSEFGLSNDSGGISSPDGAIPFNSWTFVCGEIDSSNNATIYVNGVSVATGNIGSQTFSTDFSIGQSSGGNISLGSIDDLRIYNRILSSTDITQLYAYRESYYQYFLTASSTFAVPSDWNSASNTIEVIGGGGGGATAGGGGGGYSESSNVILTPGSTVTIQVGNAGHGGSSGSAGQNGSSTFMCNSTSNCASISGTAVVAGANGGGGDTIGNGGAGGSVTGAIGTTHKYAGGAGGNYNAFGANGGTGGGGAGGPLGAGAIGGQATFTSGGGGGNGGGSAGQAGSGTAGTGGNNAQGSGGGAPSTSGTNGGGGGGGSQGGNGGNGTEWDATHGSGGGGGGSSGGGATAGGNGGLYGGGAGGDGSTAGGGLGGQGIIVVTYTPAGSSTPFSGNFIKISLSNLFTVKKGSFFIVY